MMAKPNSDSVLMMRIRQAATRAPAVVVHRVHGTGAAAAAAQPRAPPIVNYKNHTRRAERDKGIARINRADAYRRRGIITAAAGHAHRSG
ncbi:hypothetical protein E05_23050 [Plautia stali symbiont]|nr:hypothetical protein E05_23050 [Plautia stali symbiont]